MEENIYKKPNPSNVNHTSVWVKIHSMHFKKRSGRQGKYFSVGLRLGGKNYVIFSLLKAIV